MIVSTVDNPKKVGAASFVRFSLYRSGMTVAAYIAACEAAGFSATTARADLSWDATRKFIAIEAAR